MLRDLHFAPWQYGLAWGLPCVGGVLGALALRPLTARFGRSRVLLVSGAGRAMFLWVLAFLPGGVPGLIVVIVVEFLALFGSGVFNPAFATYRMNETADGFLSRVIAAWQITSRTRAAGLYRAGRVAGRRDQRADGAAGVRARCPGQLRVVAVADPIITGIVAGMRAVQFSRFGGPEVLEIVDLPDPHAGPGEVRIRVRAAGINASDWKKRQGLMDPDLPQTLGYEAAGVVDELGDGVTGVASGDEVFGISPGGAARPSSRCCRSGRRSRPRSTSPGPPLCPPPLRPRRGRSTSSA